MTAASCRDHLVQHDERRNDDCPDQNGCTLPPAEDPTRPEVVILNLVRPLAPHPGNPMPPPTFVACVMPVVGVEQRFLVTTDTGRGRVERCRDTTQFRFFQLAD